MTTYRIQVEGLPELERKLSPTSYQVALKQGMTNAVVFLEGAIKKRAPVGKTGQLRARFTHIVSSDGKEGEVGSNTSYGPFVEFGTGVYIGRGRIYPKTKKALAWDNTVRRSIAGMKGRFFVKSAVDEEGYKILPIFQAEFDKVLKGENPV